MAVHHRTVRLFVSSTFTDMRAERDLLQRGVFPGLQEHALSHGFRFQAIDLRWGVSEEAGRDNRTLRLCLRELQRCQAGPLKPNFLILLGDRYGWRPLPETLPAKLFERLCAALSAGRRKLLEWRNDQPDGAKGWYRLDENAVPPVYELQPRYGRFETLATWEEEVERPLLAALTAAAKMLRADPILPADIYAELTAAAIGRSATHQEIQHGALAIEPGEARKHVHAFARRLRDAPEQSHPDFIDLLPDGTLDSDARQRQEALRDELEYHLGGESNYHEYPLPWRDGSQFSDADLGRFQEDVFSALKQVIDQHAADLISMPPLELEEIAHLEFGVDRSQGFQSRQAPLARIADTLDAETEGMLAVLAPAGLGKSALMAEAVRQARKRYPQARIIERYLGTTPNSSDFIALLRNLVAILRIEYPPPPPLATDESRGEGTRPSQAVSEEIPHERHRLIAAFHDGLNRVTAEKPLFLFLDAIDQLASGGHPLNLNWLPTQLPAPVHLVVSTALPAEADANPLPANTATDARTRLLHSLEMLLPADRLLRLSPLTATDGAALLDHWLAADHRILTSAQRALVLETFAAEGNPLWLRVMAGEACRWHAWQTPPAQPTTLPALLTQVMDRLAGEGEHGEVLVQRALGYLACARHGLAEDEMIAVLGADPKVIRAIITHSPTERTKPEVEQIQALPLAVWVRLYGDIAGYLGELELHGATLMRFYHRSFREAVQRRHLLSAENTRELHQQLADYFVTAARGNDPDHPWKTAATRGFAECVYHLVNAAQYDQPSEILCNLRFVEARCRFGHVFELIDDYRLLREHLPEHQAAVNEERAHEAGLQRWTADIVSYARSATARLRQDMGPDSTGQSLNTTEPESNNRSVNDEEPASLEFHPLVPIPARMPTTVVGTDSPGLKLDANRLGRIKPYEQFVTRHAHLLSRCNSQPHLLLQLACNFGCDGPVSQSAERLLSTSRQVHLLEPAHLHQPWNPFPANICTFDPYGNLDGDDNWVSSLDLSANGRYLLKLAKNQVTLCEIERQTIQEARSIPLPAAVDTVRDVRLSADASRVVFLCPSGLFVSTTAGTCERRIETSNEERNLAISADACWAATSDGNVLSEWDLRTGVKHHAITTNSGAIDTLVMSADGRRIVTAHHDRVVRVHDLTSDTPPISVVLARDWAEDITLRFVRDNGVLVVYGKNDRYFFDVISRTGAHEISVPLGERYVQNVVVPKDGSKVFIGQAHHVRCFDLQTGNCILKAATWQRQQLVSLRREDSELVILSANRAADRMLTEIWTIATGQHARHWREYSGEWAAQALLTDGETLVVQRCDIAEADGGALELRDLSSGHLIRVLGPWERAGSQVVVPDDGRCLFTGSWRNGIQEWCLDGRALPQSLGNDEEAVRNFHCDAAGSVGFSSVQNCPLRVWDLLSRKYVREIPALSGWNSEVRVSPDGCAAASCEHEFVVRVWDSSLLGGRIEVERLTGHLGPIDALAMTPDGKRVVSGSGDTTIRVWDLAAGTSEVLHGHHGRVSEVDVSSDGRLCTSSSSDGSIRVWDVAASCEVKVLDSTDLSSCLRLSADGTVAAIGGPNGRVQLLDVEHGEPERDPRRHNWLVCSLCLLPDTTAVVSASADGTVGYWDLADRTHDAILPASVYVRANDALQVHSIVPIPGGFASGGEDCLIRLWDAKAQVCTDTLGARLNPHFFGATHLALTPDQSRLLSAHERIQIWDLRAREVIHSIPVRDSVDAVAISPDGRSAFFAYETSVGTMHLLDLQSTNCVKSVSRRASLALVGDAVFTPRGDALLLERHGTIELWDAQLETRLWSAPGYRTQLSPNGDDVFVVTKSGIARRTLANGETTLEFAGIDPQTETCLQQIGIGRWLQVTPDGRWLVATCHDLAVRVWSIESGECVATELLDTCPMAISRISANGVFAYGTHPGQIFIRKIAGVDIGPCLVTPRRRWIYGSEPHWEAQLVVCCPECAHVAQASGFSEKRATQCGKCGVMLRLTPFSVDRSKDFG